MSRQTRARWVALFVSSTSFFMSLNMGARAAQTLTLSLALVGAAQAMTFAEAYDAARRNDAQFRAAAHELEVTQLAVPIARSALLPSLSFNASGSEVTGSRAFPNALNQDVKVRTEYATPQASLNLRVPIFNYEALSRYRQTQLQSDQADSVYRLRGLELIDRLTTAYLQVLLTGEGQRLAQSQVQAVTAQLAQSRQRLERGEGTRVDVAQLAAGLDLARARSIEADDLLELARRQLRRHTGLATPPLRQVPADYVPAPLEQQTLRDWTDLAVRQSPSLRAREQALMAAKMGVQRNFAGHLPRLDLVASLSHSQNESISSLNQTSSLRSIGMQLTVPLYSGGGVDASVKQALAEQARIEQDIRSERETLEVEVQRHHHAVAGGQAKIAAFAEVVKSAQLALTGSQRALAGGLATSNDVVDAQARLYAAQRDLAQVRVEYLLSRARLMVQSGMTMAAISDDLDRALVAPSNPLSTSTR